MMFWLSILGFYVALLAVCLGPTYLLRLYWWLHDWYVHDWRNR